VSMYQYAATVVSVHDADTVRLTVDLGCDTSIRMTVRLAGINAPELSTPEGKVARDYLMTVLLPGRSIWIATVKDKREKYGRYLGYIYLDKSAMEIAIPGTSVNDVLVTKGYAVPYLV
jgi:micrococcal nuclease